MLAVPGFTQTSQSDSQNLKDILSEVRGIHNDGRLSETTSILLAEWQLQQTTVNGALQRTDNLSKEVAQIQAEEKSTEAQVDRLEGASSTLTLAPAQKKELADNAAHFKSELAALKVKEEPLTNNLQKAEFRLRNEQSTLDSIQAQLNEMVKKLQPVANP